MYIYMYIYIICGVVDLLMVGASKEENSSTRPAFACSSKSSMTLLHVPKNKNVNRGAKCSKN